MYMSWFKNLFNKIANKDKTFNSNISSKIDASDTKIKGNVSNIHNKIYPNDYYRLEIGKKLSEAHSNFLNAKSKLLNCSKCSKKINAATPLSTYFDEIYLHEYDTLWNIRNPNNITLRTLDVIENTVCVECKQQIKIMKKSIVDYDAYAKAAKLNKI